MKNLKIIIVISLIMFVGLLFLVRCCDYEEDPLAKVEVGEMHDYRFDDVDIPELDTPKEYMSYVKFKIKYKREIEGNDYYKLPEKTWIDKEGDCEDKTILFMYLIKTRLNLQNIKFLLIYKDNEVHALAKVTIQNQTQYYDPSYNKMWNILPYPIIHEIPYAEIMWMTYYYHDTVGKYY